MPSNELAATPERWRSMGGFVLATIGSAVGLGDIWRFAYVAGSHGGGLFMLIYVAMLLLICMPLLAAELAIGKAAQCAPDRAYQRVLVMSDALAGEPSHSVLRAVGALGWVSVIAAFVILSYYSVISGWVLRYLALFVFQDGATLDALAQTGAFEGFVARAWEPLAWHGLSILICAVIVTWGVRDGIERTARYMLPTLFLLLLALAVYASTLPNAVEGLKFLFVPQWSHWRDPNLYLAALGQAFFSIGLASGCLMAYGSYAGSGTSLPVATVAITLGDTLASVVAGMAIFMTVFSFGHSPGAGPTLAFVTLPNLFALMPAGRWVGLGFFLLLAIAAIGSAVSLLEVPVAVLKQRFGLSRRLAAPLVAMVVFLAGVPSSLGYGPLKHLGWQIEAHGERLPLLDLIDTLLSEYVLPLNGLAMAVFVGWVWNRKAAMTASGLQGRVGVIWLVLLRFLVPAMIAIVVVLAFLQSLGL